ncbi:MAG: Na/Pi symporter, partial [Bacteroidota bacterium]
MLKHFIGWIVFLAICFAIPGRAQEPRATPPPSIEFNNLFSETHEPEAIKLYWSCVNGSDNVVIRYRRAIKGDAPWVYTAPIPGDNLHYELTELLGNESYIWQVGGSPSGDFSNPDQVIWSGEEKFKTLRGFGFLGFMIILGALGFFIYGMKVMSEGIQKVAGQKMRNILGAMTSNRFMGLLTGIFITGLIQSSSATTVMTVSFVNAGLLSLAESIG